MRIPGKTSGKMEANAGVDGSDQKFVRTELRDERRAVDVVGPRRTATVVLWIAIRDRGLPVAEVEFLLRFPGQFHRSFQLAFEVQPGNFSNHGSHQFEVARMAGGWHVAENVPATGINAKGSDADRAFAQRREEILGERVGLGNFRDK